MTAKRLEFAVTERFGDPPHAEPDWKAEHLVLAGLARCSLASLEHSAKRASLTVSGTAAADGVVTKREEDGRYAFVEISCRLDVTLDPPLTGDELQELLARAEYGCFVGASLTAKPRYSWRVNGEAVP